eukprot:477438-Rhodomonas_salina.1
MPTETLRFRRKAIHERTCSDGQLTSMCSLPWTATSSTAGRYGRLLFEFRETQGGVVKSTEEGAAGLPVLATRRQTCVLLQDR